MVRGPMSKVQGRSSRVQRLFSVFPPVRRPLRAGGRILRCMRSRAMAVSDRLQAPYGARKDPTSWPAQLLILNPL